MLNFFRRSESAQSTSFGITQGCPSWKQQTERMVMKAGLNLLNFASWANPRALQKLAENEEQLGYHFLMISDHVAVTPDVAARYPAPFYDPFITLAWLSGIT